MKLSEILKPQKKYAICPNFTGEELPEPNSRNIQFQYGFNSALTSCDREIDREALVEELKQHGRMLTYEEFADLIISTMPTWLKRSKGN